MSILVGLFRNTLFVIAYFVFAISFFISCVEERDVATIPETSYLSVKGIGTLSSFDQRDNIVNTLRILAFDGSGQCKSNVYYNAHEGDIIRHPIKTGTYDFVFIANEPPYIDINTQLNTISQYSDLASITFSEKSFTSDMIIPMMQEIDNVKVLPEGRGAQIDGGITVSIIDLELDRMGIRVDVTLEAKEDLSGAFTGITFRQIPDKVPLMPSAYSGAITRNISRTFTVSANSGYFSQVTPTQEQTDRGIVWVMNITRFIMPSGIFSPETDVNKAIIFNVNLEDKYNPSCALKIKSSPGNDYTFPFNTALHLTATMDMPLEVNIKASDWDQIENDWLIPGIRYLNVSQIKAGITDLNGVRISFWSNMPKVRVLPTVTKDGSEILETNNVFNDLVGNGTFEPYRFNYDTLTGNGYMDILVDGNTGTKTPGAQSGSYKIVLSGEEADGSNPIQREITVDVIQNGYRFNYSLYSTRFAGAFYRNNETGERIISGQYFANVKEADLAGTELEGKDIYWQATANEDWIILSSTPSFDPGTGTDSPGNAEKYKVVPNEYKGETGKTVKGRGRIYFRVGLTGVNPNPANAADNNFKKPRYGTITLRYYNSLTSTWMPAAMIYVRQGEDPDYVYEENDIVTQHPNAGIATSYQPLIGQQRTSAVRFSPYNLTATNFRNGGNDYFYQVPVNNGAFVEYPSQAGAMFQWAVDINNTLNDVTGYRRRAYHPVRNLPAGTSLGTYWANGKDLNNVVVMGNFKVMWKPDASNISYSNYSVTFETCPPGYHRPSDGPINTITENGPYPTLASAYPTPAQIAAQIALSEMRVSLYKYPFSGNAHSNADLPTINDTYAKGTFATDWANSNNDKARRGYEGTVDAFYSDGFFDRRPILATGSGYGVSVNNAYVAYKGIIFFNTGTNASVFFPVAGRINNDTGQLEARASTGYYWTSSVGPEYTGDEYGTKWVTYGAWQHEINYYFMNVKNVYTTFGGSIRCVKTDN